MDDMDEDMFTEEVAGLCNSLTQDYDDGDHPLIYEVYTQPIDKKSVHITDIKWDTDGEDIDLPSEVTINVDIDADGDEIVDKLSDEYGWCVLQASFEE